MNIDLIRCVFCPRVWMWLTKTNTKTITRENYYSGSKHKNTSNNTSKIKAKQDWLRMKRWSFKVSIEPALIPAASTLNAELDLTLIVIFSF